MGDLGKAADFFDGARPHHHGGTEGELHSLEHGGDQNPRGHFDGHAHGLKLRPKAVAGDSAIDAGDHADLLVAHGLHDGGEIIRADAHIAVGGHQDGITSFAAHDFQRKGARIGPGRLATGEDARLDLRVTRSNAASRSQAGVGAVPGAKEYLELRIILLKKAGEILFQILFVAMHGLQHA